MIGPVWAVRSGFMYREPDHPFTDSNFRNQKSDRIPLESETTPSISIRSDRFRFDQSNLLTLNSRTNLIAAGDYRALSTDIARCNLLLGNIIKKRIFLGSVFLFSSCGRREKKKEEEDLLIVLMTSSSTVISFSGSN